MASVLTFLWASNTVHIPRLQGLLFTDAVKNFNFSDFPSWILISDTWAEFVRNDPQHVSVKVPGQLGFSFNQLDDFLHTVVSTRQQHLGLTNRLTIQTHGPKMVPLADWNVHVAVVGIVVPDPCLEYISCDRCAVNRWHDGLHLTATAHQLTGNRDRPSGDRHLQRVGFCRRDRK